MLYIQPRGTPKHKRHLLISFGRLFFPCLIYPSLAVVQFWFGGTEAGPGAVHRTNQISTDLFWKCCLCARRTSPYTPAWNSHFNTVQARLRPGCWSLSLYAAWWSFSSDFWLLPGDQIKGNSFTDMHEMCLCGALDRKRTVGHKETSHACVEKMGKLVQLQVTWQVLLNEHSLVAG